MPVKKTRVEQGAAPVTQTVGARAKAYREAERRYNQARGASILLKHVSDPTRLQVILILTEGERHVGALCALLSESQPAVSHHLALLRHGGIIAPRREGKNNFYSLTETGADLARLVEILIEEEPTVVRPTKLKARSYVASGPERSKTKAPNKSSVKLEFKLEFKSQELRSIDFPVEVRRSNFSLVKRCLTSDPVEVEPGKYFITALLPAGQALSSLVEVSGGVKKKMITLTPEQADASPADTLEFVHYLSDRLEVSSLRRRDDSSPGGTKVRLRWFRGNLLKKIVSITSEAPFVPNRRSVVPISGDREGTTVIQLLQPKRLPLNVVAPVGPDLTCEARFPRHADGNFGLWVYPKNLEAVALPGYMSKGLIDQVDVAVNPRVAERLLKRKGNDPIAATVGAYALLRLGEIERLHDWTKNLMNWFAWLPDGITIRGEHLSRLGKHREAVAVFVNLSKRDHAPVQRRTFLRSPPPPALSQRVGRSFRRRVRPAIGCIECTPKARAIRTLR